MTEDRDRSIHDVCITLRTWVFDLDPLRPGPQFQDYYDQGPDEIQVF
jgi:hypothetical protein